MAAVLTVLSLASCGSKDEPANSDFALPITAPMHARERLMNDMRKHKVEALKRRREFEATSEQNR
jgi:hypothetical protein